VIGVGGGRDILSAIWAGHSRVTGIEVNGRVIELLTGSHRAFTRIADHAGVELVHDEARSHLARDPTRFDVLQMSLVDTWAATGAGAFTLSENGLYTVEAWRLFLDRLQPAGILSVSRWFSDRRPLETSRLLALAVATLIDRGVTNPSAHLVLSARGNVATLLVSATPFTADDLQRVERVARDHGLSLLVSPSLTPATELAAIVGSRTRAELAAATRDDRFDLTAPDDSRPFFFNMLRPGAWLRGDATLDAGGVIAGNLRATNTLLVLFGLTTAFVISIIVFPLVLSGRPAMPAPAFVAGLAYFGAIGSGFMLTQVAFLQRFSVFLGHPTYTFACVLFSMILFAGAGSFASPVLSGPRQRWFLLVPASIAAWLIVTAALLPGVLARAMHLELPWRVAIVLACSGPLSFLLGFCFPAGARQIERLDARALAWMWGANGATGVLASVVAVMVSIWVGIEANLLLAAACYVSLVGLAYALMRMQPVASRANASSPVRMPTEWPHPAGGAAIAPAPGQAGGAADEAMTARTGD
jgi:hypothetical protein